MQRSYSSIQLGNYPFLLPLISLVVGIIIYHNDVFTIKNFQLISIGLGVALFFSFLLHLQRNPSQTTRISRKCSFALLFIAIGLSLSFFHDVHNQKKWFGNDLENKDAFLVSVIGSPQVKTKIIQIPVSIEAVHSDDKWQMNHGRMNVNLYLEDSIPYFKIGDQLIIPNKLSLIESSKNPFSFDQAAYQNNQGYYYHCFLSFEDIGLIYSDLDASDLWMSLRSGMINTIYRNVRDSTTAALMAAVIVNERAALDRDLWEDYSRTGVAHIVAISGMHITMFFSILAAMLFWIKSKKWNWVKYLIIFPFIWCYIAITGFPPSAVRAGIMFSILAIAIWVRRDDTIINSLFATAFVILIFRPQWLYDVGFQLSFLSVLSIFIFYKPIASMWQVENKILSFFWNTISVSIAVQILLTPLIMYYFHQFSLWSVIANLPAAIYSAGFMILSLLLILIGSMGIDMIWLGDIITFITNIFHSIISFFSDYSPQIFHHIFITKIEYWLLTSLIILIASMWSYKRKQIIWPIAANVILLLSCFIWNTIRHNQQNTLIVYQATRKSLIELIQGRSSTLWHQPDLTANDIKYILDPAHLGFGIKENNKVKLQNKIFSIEKQKIIMLCRPFESNVNASFPIDILILSRECSNDLSELISIFSPKKIILDSSFTRGKSNNLKQKIKELGVDCHSVLLDGAYVIPYELE